MKRWVSELRADVSKSRKKRREGYALSYTALGHPYVLTEDGIDELIQLDAAGSAPSSSPNFVSRMASPERLLQLNAMLIRRSS